MRYAIGAKVLENDGTVYEGIFGYGEYLLPYIITNDKYKSNTNCIPVFSDRKEAEDCVRHLCSVYRMEFHNRAKRYNLDISQFRFFLIKVDSLKFNKRIKGERYLQNKTKYKSKKIYWIE